VGKNYNETRKEFSEPRHQSFDGGRGGPCEGVGRGGKGQKPGKKKNGSGFDSFARRAIPIKETRGRTIRKGETSGPQLGKYSLEKSEGKRYIFQVNHRGEGVAGAEERGYAGLDDGEKRVIADEQKNERLFQKRGSEDVCSNLTTPAASKPDLKDVDYVKARDNKRMQNIT